MAINTTLLFFLLLVPLSGLIALVGDRIGHRNLLCGMRAIYTMLAVYSMNSWGC